MVEERLCRCCRISTYRLVNLKAKVNVPGVEKKTYKDILHEMAIGMIQNIEEHDETIFPKKACNKCIRQIKQSYKFLLKVQSSYEYFMELDQKDDECGETEDSNVLLETYVEKPETHALLFEAESEVDTKGKDIGIDICRAGETELEEITIEIEQAEQFTNFETSHSEQLNNEDSFDGRQTACSSNETETEKSDVESLGGKEMSPEPIAFICEICRKIFKDKKSLNIHTHYTHMPDEEKMSCPLCDHKTSRPSVLKVHMESKHGKQSVEEFFREEPTDSKPFVCNVCGRSFGRRYDMNRHIQIIHTHPKTPRQKREKCYLCPHCGQSHNSKKGLENHLISHTDDRPYVCGICNKAYKRVREMKVHQRIHSDLKPFQCSICGKSFRRRDKLKTHMSVHSDLRPYICRQCEKSFKYRSVLRTHMYVHTGQMPFECKTCCETFPLNSLLTDHYLKSGHVK